MPTRVALRLRRASPPRARRSPRRAQQPATSASRIQSGPDRRSRLEPVLEDRRHRRPDLERVHEQRRARRSDRSRAARPPPAPRRRGRRPPRARARRRAAAPHAREREASAPRDRSRRARSTRSGSRSFTAAIQRARARAAAPAARAGCARSRCRARPRREREQLREPRRQRLLQRLGEVDEARERGGLVTRAGEELAEIPEPRDARPQLRGAARASSSSSASRGMRALTASLRRRRRRPRPARRRLRPAPRSGAGPRSRCRRARGRSSRRSSRRAAGIRSPRRRAAVGEARVGVRADVVDRVELALHVAERDLDPVEDDPARLAGTRSRDARATRRQFTSCAAARAPRGAGSSSGGRSPARPPACTRSRWSSRRT